MRSIETKVLGYAGENMDGTIVGSIIDDLIAKLRQCHPGRTVTFIYIMFTTAGAFVYHAILEGGPTQRTSSFFGCGESR